jgi:hypothetical protein
MPRTDRRTGHAPNERALASRRFGECVRPPHTFVAGAVLCIAALSACSSGSDGATPPAGGGGATKLGFTVQPGSTIAGTATTPAVQVAVQDGQGNTVTTSTASVTLAIGGNPAGSTLTGATVAAVGGVATFSSLSINKAGIGYTLTASATGLTSATSSAFNVSAGAPSELALVAGNNQIAAAGAPVTQAPSIRVNDIYGNAVSGVVVAFVVTGGGGTVTGATQTTNTAGSATVGSWTLGSSAAINRLEARSGDLSAAVIQAQSWTLSPTTVALQAIGDSQAIWAFLGADSTSTVSLSVASESRWLQEIPVTDREALQTGIVRASAPGSARIRVRAFGVDLGDVLVSVTPSTPLVFSVQQPGWPKDPTLVVRGYRMNTSPAATILIGGLPATKLAVDSAQLTADPGLASTTACVLSTTDQVAIAGIATLWTGTARRLTAVPAMAIGETRTLQGGAFCLKLPPQVGSYALAQVDRAWMDHAATIREDRRDSLLFPPYTYSAGDRSSGVLAAALARQPPVRAGIARQSQVRPPSIGDAQRLAAPASVTDISSRATPWLLGEVFSAPGGSGVDLGTDTVWRVMRLYPNNVVLAISQRDSAVLWTPSIVARLDSAFAFVLGSVGDRFYQTTFGSAVPTTSPGSGQLLVFVDNDARSWATAFESCRVTGSGPIGSDIQFGPQSLGVSGGGSSSAALLMQAVAHEYSHAWDCMRTGNTSATWAEEGLAQFVQEDMRRLYLGLAIDDNLAPEVGMVPAQPPGILFTWWNLPFGGWFQSGYGESASFMRHLAWWLTSTQGVPWEQSRAAVIRGSSEGWYGLSNLAGPGLVARVKQLAGAQWTPVDARLDWVLSLAADDRATAKALDFRYAALLASWKILEDTDKRTPAYRPGFYRGTIVAGSGQAVAGTARVDENGYVLVDDPNGVGTALELKASIASMVWKVLRYR